MSIQIHYSIHQNLLFTRFFSNYTIFCSTSLIVSCQHPRIPQFKSLIPQFIIQNSSHNSSQIIFFTHSRILNLRKTFKLQYYFLSIQIHLHLFYISHNSFQIIPFSIPVNIQESLNSQEKFQIIIFRHSVSSISYILNPRNSPNRNTTSCLFKFISSALRSSHLLDTQESTISAVQLESNNSRRDGLFHQQPSVSISSQGYNRSVVGAALVGQINTRKEWPPESDRYAGCKGSANWMQSRGRGTFRFRCLTPFIYLLLPQGAENLVQLSFPSPPPLSFFTRCISRLSPLIGF